MTKKSTFRRKDGSRVSAQDPWGCLAPIGLGDPTRPLAYIGYWAVPHPTVYFTMLAITIEDYLVFLKKYQFFLRFQKIA